MSQQINLFNPIFHKKGFSFTSSTALLYGFCITVAVGATAAGYARYELYEASARAQAVEQLHKDTNARFEKLTSALVQQKPNAQIEAEVASLDMQLKGRQEIIETLNSGAVGNTGGFSEYMRAFARESVTGLWMTGFDLAQGGNELAIQGRTLNPDLVATYIKQLNHEKSLQGRQFSALRIGQPASSPAARTPAETEAAINSQAQKNVQEPPAAQPRYLEFTISTADIPEDAAQQGKPAATRAPLLGAIDPNAVVIRKPAAGQEVSR
jgi:Tfp pilus assembly protein PilN